MSPDADRIPRCIRCGKRRGDAVATKCNRDGVGCDFEGGRIAALEAELAEWKLRAEVAEKQWNRVLDVEAERDAALAEAKAAVSAYRAQLGNTRHYQAVAKSAQDALQATQADAAVMRDVLVYARDQLDHLAKFHGYDLTLLRGMIGKLIGNPAPEVGSTFRRVFEAYKEGNTYRVTEDESALAARVPLLEKTLQRVGEIFPQLRETFIHGEHGSTAKLITALGIALAALDETGGG